jgi:hypothetical protein
MTKATMSKAASRARAYYRAGVQGQIELARAALAAAQSDGERAEWRAVLVALGG